MEAVETLNSFINTTREAREMRRALAVKLEKEGYAPQEICRILNVSRSFVSKWKKIFAAQGVAGLRLGYKGSRGCLSPAQRSAIITWLRNQKVWDVTALRTYVQEHYRVEYKSWQSYYALCKAAGISWKKTQRADPQKDPARVAAKRAEIEHKITGWAAKIRAGKMAFFFIDECHLLWGDICGYVWGRTDQRITVPIKNEKQRQTYYGALKLCSGQTLVRAYPTADSAQTVHFVKYLRQQNPEQRLVIAWDGASYHRFAEMQEYLAGVNDGLPEDEWPVTCVLFAPYAPEQNPMEDVWLRGKDRVRKNYHRCASFPDVKELFVNTVDQQTFDFPKLRDYRQFLQMI